MSRSIDGMISRTARPGTPGPTTRTSHRAAYSAVGDGMGTAQLSAEGRAASFRDRVHLSHAPAARGPPPSRFTSQPCLDQLAEPPAGLHRKNALAYQLVVRCVGHARQPVERGKPLCRHPLQRRTVRRKARVSELSAGASTRRLDLAWREQRRLRAGHHGVARSLHGAPPPDRLGPLMSSTSGALVSLATPRLPCDTSALVMAQSTRVQPGYSAARSGWS